MRRVHTILTVVLALALIVALGLWRNSQRELQRQLHTITDANGALRQSLGDLAVEITKKEREIDRLESSCSVQEKKPDSFPIPLLPERHHGKTGDTGSIGAN